MDDSDRFDGSTASDGKRLMWDTLITRAPEYETSDMLSE